MSTLEEELQQREADLRAAHAQLQATQRSLVSLQVGAASQSTVGSWCTWFTGAKRCVEVFSRQGPHRWKLLHTLQVPDSSLLVARSQADGQAHRDSASTTAQALAASQQQAAAMQVGQRGHVYNKWLQDCAETATTCTDESRVTSYVIPDIVSAWLSPALWCVPRRAIVSCKRNGKRPARRLAGSQSRCVARRCMQALRAS